MPEAEKLTWLPLPVLTMFEDSSSVMILTCLAVESSTSQWSRLAETDVVRPWSSHWMGMPPPPPDDAEACETLSRALWRHERVMGTVTIHGPRFFGAYAFGCQLQAILGRWIQQGWWHRHLSKKTTRFAQVYL